MTKFLCMQHTYHGVEVALYSFVNACVESGVALETPHVDIKLMAYRQEDKKRASKYFVSLINAVLQDSHTQLQELSFIAANRGPGPFTTLRTVLASVNGLALAIQKPLLGIDGLDAILQEYRKPAYAINIALLDAYSKDVYYGIDHKDNPEFEKGYKNISVFLAELEHFAKHATNIYFIGNGAQKYQEEIISVFGDRAVFDNPIVSHCSIGQIAKMAVGLWEKQEGLADQLLPLYLKSRMF